MKRISSRKHPLVAACRALAHGRGSDPGRMLLDGAHLVEEALAAGCGIEVAALESTFLARPEGVALAAALQGAGTEAVEVSAPVLDALSPVASPSGVVAIARRPARPLDAVLGRAPQLLVLAVDVQDPGNVGAIARSAEAAAATGLLLAGGSADPFGWKALRGSMGSLLRLPVAASLPWQEAVAAVRAAGVRIAAALPRGGRSLYDLDLRGPVAFLVGAEGPGLPPAAAAAADEEVSIPMAPPVESLNVSIAAALLLFEAARQRREDASAL